MASIIFETYLHCVSDDRGICWSNPVRQVRALISPKGKLDEGEKHLTSVWSMAGKDMLRPDAVVKKEEGLEEEGEEAKNVSLVSHASQGGDAIQLPPCSSPLHVDLSRFEETPTKHHRITAGHSTARGES